MRARPVLLLALTGTLALAAPASAATVSAPAGLEFAAASGEANLVQISSTDGINFHVVDSLGSLSVGPGCVQATTAAADCTLLPGSVTVTVDVGDEDDEVDLRGIAVAPPACVPAAISGGAGDDDLSAGMAACTAADTSVAGGAGKDSLTALGAATLNGDGEDDRLAVSLADDVLDGGAGTDTADFSGHASSVVVDLGDSAFASGSTGEDDELVNIEDAVGGSAGDVLRGSASANRLDGGAGADRLDGRLGADELIGGDGRDTAWYGERTASLVVALDGTPTSGDAGDGPVGVRDSVATSVENVVAGTGDDMLTGNANGNVITGGPGADELTGAGGEDVADYSERTESVRVALDGTANSGSLEDGPAGARDLLATDVEDVWGGSGGDILIGNTGANLLNGGYGADVLSGGPGADAADYSERSEGLSLEADGTPGSGSSLDGAAGARDTISSDIEDLIGGRGSDRLTGNQAPNRLDAGGGDDVIDSRDASADVDTCGAGNDEAWVSDNDTARLDCEYVGAGPRGGSTSGGGAGDGGSDGGSGPPPPVADKTPPALSIRAAATQSLTTLLRRGLAIGMSASEPANLVAELVAQRATARRLGLGSARTVIAVGHAELVAPGRGAVIVKLVPAAKRKLRRASALRVTLRFAATDRAGNTAYRLKTLSLRAATRRR